MSQTSNSTLATLRVKYMFTIIIWAKKFVKKPSKQSFEQDKVDGRRSVKVQRILQPTLLEGTSYFLGS